jgi:glycosyltransferase involved in cell wall biosynthesis
MKVLHLSAGNLYGGVETLLVTLARYRHLFPEMEPEFGVCFEGRLSRELAAEGVEVYRLGEARVRLPLSVLRARQRLTRLLHEHHFDVVVCHMVWPQAIFGSVVCSAGLPLVLWIHNPIDGQHWLERLARRTQPTLTLYNSHFTKVQSRDLYPDLPGATVYYPVAGFRTDIEGAREAIRGELKTAADSVVIVQVSRLEEWKGHQTLIEALGLLHDVPDWTCWIVGGAQRAEEVRYLDQIKLASTRLGISNRVRFAGQRSDVERLLTAADVFCQPNSGPEPFGIVFIEALYAGLPVVATAIGGALEIVDESCGLVVPPTDPKALAIALRNLVADADLRGKLSRSGPSRAIQLCDPARQMERLNSFFRTSIRFDDEKRVAWNR